MSLPSFKLPLFTKFKFADQILLFLKLFLVVVIVVTVIILKLFFSEDQHLASGHCVTLHSFAWDFYCLGLS